MNREKYTGIYLRNVIFYYLTNISNRYDLAHRKAVQNMSLRPRLEYEQYPLMYIYTPSALPPLYRKLANKFSNAMLENTDRKANAITKV